MGAALVALVVAVGIPSSAFAADIADNAVATGAVESVTTNNEIISTVQSNENAEQNKVTVKDESGNLPETDKDVVEKPALEPKAEGPVAQEPVPEKPTAEEPVVVVEGPVVTEPAVVVEEPVTTEPAVVVEEPVATEPAVVVEEPVATEPAIVVEEAVVTEPAIVVEPATLTVTHILKLDDGQLEHTDIINGIAMGSDYDISALVNETEEVKCISDIRTVKVDDLNKTVVLEYQIVKKERATEDTEGGSLND